MQGLEREIATRLNQTVTSDENVLHKFIDAAGDLAVNLVVAVIILTVTWWAAGWASRLVRRLIARVHGGGPPDVTLQGFAGSAARYLVMIVGLIAVLQQLGVQATSILAVLGAASLAIGLALQGTLSNVAAGVMLLLFRPYRVGDVIEVSGGTRSLVSTVNERETALAGVTFPALSTATAEKVWGPSLRLLSVFGVLQGE